MFELITVVALILLVRFWVNPHKKKKSSAAEKENNLRKQNPKSIVGESTFVLSTSRHAQTKKKEVPEPDSSGKINIEVPLIYEPDNELIEEQEELERLGLQTDNLYNITPDEMMLVINEVGSHQSKTTPEAGKLLYENENTDWVEQLSSSSVNSANRISSLIDLHLERLVQPNSNMKPDNGLREFDIGKYVN
jgi:hypothetical protein